MYRQSVCGTRIVWRLLSSSSFFFRGKLTLSGQLADQRRGDGKVTGHVEAVLDDTERRVHDADRQTAHIGRDVQDDSLKIFEHFFPSFLYFL